MRNKLVALALIVGSLVASVFTVAHDATAQIMVVRRRPVVFVRAPPRVVVVRPAPRVVYVRPRPRVYVIHR